MVLQLTELKRLHGTSVNYSQGNRERVADDFMFYWVSHYAGDRFADTLDDEYRGEFDLLRKGIRAILADLASNPIQNDFEPRDEDREDAADLADGMYRADCNNNTSIEAFSNGDQEAVIGGFGAWEFRTEEEVTTGGKKRNTIKRYPIFEANNTAYCDPNARLLDKSDSNFWSIITPYSEDGYKALYEELTGEEVDGPITAESFSEPEDSDSFSWYEEESKKIYITSFYHRVKVDVDIYTILSPTGEIKEYTEDDLDGYLDDMLTEGFEVLEEWTDKRWEVRKYIASGKEILNGEEEDGERVGELVVGPNIPIIPQYGDHTYVDGEEHCEGAVRLAKDPVRLHDAAWQYLADIFGKGPGQKTILTKEQIQGLEHYWEAGGLGNNDDYALINSTGEHGDPVQKMVGQTPDTPVPQAATALIGGMRQSVEDVVSDGSVGDIADVDLSNRAIMSLQARLDLQTVVYQDHRKHARRRDAEVWAGMASIINDVPQTRKIERPDGTKKTVKILDMQLDAKTGEYKVLNDLTNVEFDVYSKISASYNSQKEQTLDRIDKMTARQVPGSPTARMLELKALQLIDGVDFEDIRDWSRKELIKMGVQTPETDEEIAMMEAQAQQAQKPSAEEMLGQGKLLEGQAKMAGEETKRMTAQADIQSDQVKQLIDKFKAITDRMDAQVSAQETGAKIEKTKSETFSNQIDNRTKIVELQKPANMSDADLMSQYIAG